MFLLKIRPLCNTKKFAESNGQENRGGSYSVSREKISLRVIYLKIKFFAKKNLSFNLKKQ